MTTTVHELGAHHAPLITEHFCALDAEDRRLRFGFSLKDEAIAAYVKRIRFTADVVFGVYADDLTLVGVAHLALRANPAELGLSVLPQQRGNGIGTLLLRRAVVRARNCRIERLFMHCLSENNAVLHIARKEGMRVVHRSGEADASLQLPPGTAATLSREVAESQAAWFDWAIKAAWAGSRAAIART